MGLQTVRRRRITARGITPIGHQQHGCEHFYVYGAVAPKDGAGDFVGVLTLNADLVQVFLDMFATARATTLNVCLVDTSRCHTATALVIPAHVVRRFQPPYAPEVHPAERVWQALKTALAWQCFPHLAQLQARVGELVQSWDATTLRSLTAYPFLMQAINALSP